LYLVFVLFGAAFGDLRCASQPKNLFKTQSRGNVQFVPEYCLYMEPSAFNYAGLEKQRDEKAYDQFLRSNIDNEQDKRNFETEPGLDHIPFRSFESAFDDSHDSVLHKIDSSPAKPAIVVTTGIPHILPLRWNNPHASEIEINLWINRGETVDPVVVPIRRPACSGEGYQDNVLEFTIPQDFVSLGSKIVGFEGCISPGDCMIQAYAHSVESRQYAFGIPVIVKVDAETDQTALGPSTAPVDDLQPAGLDPGVDIAKTGVSAERRFVCLASNAEKVDIESCVPRVARLVSDVFNHAYQNSDYSPYAGQQPESISQNLQASIILKMTVGNRGELGKKYFKETNKAGYNKAKELDKKARELVKTYEGITNQVIAVISKRMAQDNVLQKDTMSQGQETNVCFRCAEVGSTTTKRKTTNTYIPSFTIAAKYLKEAAQYVAPAYGHLITVKNGVGYLQIYSAVLKDMESEFLEAGKLEVHYLPAAIKTTAFKTKDDATQFRKIDANNEVDDGSYAAEQVQAEIKLNEIPVKQGMTASAMTGIPINEQLCKGSIIQGLDELIQDLDAVTEADAQFDMDGLMQDADCDDDAKLAANPNLECSRPGADRMIPGQLFPGEGQVENDPRASSAVGPVLSWVSAFSLVLGVVFQL